MSLRSFVTLTSAEKHPSLDVGLILWIHSTNDYSCCTTRSLMSHLCHVFDHSFTITSRMRSMSMSIRLTFMCSCVQSTDIDASQCIHAKYMTIHTKSIQIWHQYPTSHSLCWSRKCLHRQTKPALATKAIPPLGAFALLRPLFALLIYCTYKLQHWYLCVRVCLQGRLWQCMLGE